MNEKNEFDFELDLDDTDMSDLLKKAKRKNLIKSIGISAAVTIVVLAGTFVGFAQLENWSLRNMERDVMPMNNITRPNVYNVDPNAVKIDDGFFRDMVEYRTYKNIEGIPVAWETRTYEYSIWGTSRQVNRQASLVLDEGQNEVNVNYNPYTMQREMEFYLPFLTYKAYANDLPTLSNMPGKAAELAISFDKPYTVDQIRKMLPDGVHPKWYWVDTYYNKQSYLPHEIDADQKQPDGSIKPGKATVTQDSPESATQVYGFDADPRSVEHGDGTEKNFLLLLQTGLDLSDKYETEFQSIRDYLKGDKPEPSPSDVRLFGVVVTGTTDNLQKLTDAPYLKAAVLGASVDLQ